MRNGELLRRARDEYERAARELEARGRPTLAWDALTPQQRAQWLVAVAMTEENRPSERSTRPRNGKPEDPEG